MKITDVFFLLLAATQLIAQQQRKIEETLPTRQVHLDFHTSEQIPNIGAQFDKKQFQSALLPTWSRAFLLFRFSSRPVQVI